MTYLEWLKNKAEEFNVLNFTGICLSCYKLKNKGKGCSGKNCNYCEFNDIEKCIDYLLAEHKEPIKLKQWEYDLLIVYGYKNTKFKQLDLMDRMQKRGNFKGVEDTSMKIEDILANCEIVSDDYEGFDDCK